MRAGTPARWAAAIALGAALGSGAGAEPGSGSPPRPRKVAILLYEGAALIDFAGPQDVLSHAGTLRKFGGRPAFEVFTVAPAAGEVKIGGGPRVLPDRTLGDAVAADIVVIPGGPNEPLLRDEATMARLDRLLRGAEVALSVCNGAVVLGALHRLDGIEATSSVNEGLRRRFPEARVRDGARVVDAGRVITTSSGATGIDGALCLVARLLDRETAVTVAEHMAYPWVPPSGGPLPPPSAGEGHAMPEASPGERLYQGAVEKAADEGDAAGALEWLRRALESGYEPAADALRETAFDPIREDPALRRRFRELLAGFARQSEVEMVAGGEPGERIVIELEVLEPGTDRPVPGALVHATQPDASGRWAPEAGTDRGADNPRLFSFARSDTMGRVRLHTVAPGPGAGCVQVRVSRGGAAELGPPQALDLDRSGDPRRPDGTRERVIRAKVYAPGP